MSARSHFTEPAFGFPVGPWHAWFAWRPIWTRDTGWRWLRKINRRRYQLHDYLPGPVSEWWEYRLIVPHHPGHHNPATTHAPQASTQSAASEAER